MSKLFNLVVLISGHGSNLQAIIDFIQKEKLACQICAVVSNQKEAYGLVRAHQAGIPTSVVEHTKFSNKTTFENTLIKAIDQYTPDLVVLAGFMRILLPNFVEHYFGRLINIHPSLLPKFPGLNTHAKALAAKEPIHGATVHFVTKEVDIGPIIIQGKVPLLPNDTPLSLQNRVHQMEYKIYPLAIRWFLEKRILLQNNQVYLDGKLLPASGFCYTCL